MDTIIQYFYLRSFQYSKIPCELERLLFEGKAMIKNHRVYYFITGCVFVEKDWVFIPQIILM